MIFFTNKCSFFIAPKLFGQSDAKSVVELAPIKTLKDVLTLDNISIKQYENDVCITGFCRVKKSDTLLK